MVVKLEALHIQDQYNTCINDVANNFDLVCDVIIPVVRQLLKNSQEMIGRNGLIKKTRDSNSYFIAIVYMTEE